MSGLVILLPIRSVCLRHKNSQGEASGGWGGRRGVEGRGLVAVAAVAKAGGNVVCTTHSLAIKHLAQPVALVLHLALFSSLDALNSLSHGRALSERGELDSRRFFAGLRGRRREREEAAQGQGKQCRQ